MPSIELDLLRQIHTLTMLYLLKTPPAESLCSLTVLCSCSATVMYSGSSRVRSYSRVPLLAEEGLRGGASHVLSESTTIIGQ